MGMGVASSGRIDIIQELDQEDELSCFHPIEVWKAIDLFIRIKEKEEDRSVRKGV